MSAFLNSEDKKPLVLILSEQNVAITSLVESSFQTHSLATEILFLDESFLAKSNLFLKSERLVYKIIVLYGFQDKKALFYRQIFDFINKLLEVDSSQNPSIVLLSSVSSSLKFIDTLDIDYDKFLSGQEAFFSSFLAKFPQSQVFLAKDLILDADEKITYPLLFFFSAFRQGHLLDPQGKLYLQDEQSYFDLIKDRLVRPHQSEKFLIKGKSLQTESIVKKISYLYEQYFQKKLETLRLFSEEETPQFLKEFTVVQNSKAKVDSVLDQKIRLLPHSLDNSFKQTLNLEVLKKAASVSEQKKFQSQKQPQNKQIKSVKDNFLDLFRKAQKTPLSSSVEEVYSEDLVGKIDTIFSSRRHVEKQSRQEENLKQGKKILHKSKKRKWLFYLGAVILTLGITSLSLLSFFDYSQKKLQRDLFTVVKDGSKSVEKIYNSILFNLFYFQYNQSKKFLLEESLTHAADIFRLKDSIEKLTLAEAVYLKNSFNLYKKILEGGVELKQPYEETLLSLDQKIEAEKAFNAYLMDLNLDLYEGEEREVWESQLEKSKSNLASSAQMKRFLESFKELFLLGSRVNLLVLIQDSNELRPSGGLLTEAVMLSFEKGELIDKQVFSVDDLSNRVYGHREAPPEIRQFLDEEIFYLRDANWNADFSAAGRDILWFIEQSIGQKVDLMMAVTPETITQMLGVIGELNLASGLKINAENYVENLRTKALLDYKSQGESRFTWQFAKNLLDKLIVLSELEYSQIGATLTNSLNRRETLLFSPQTELQQTIEANSWSGKKIETVCPPEFQQENCLTDSFYQLESNISINKVSHFIQRTISHDIGITELFIRHRRKITFENTASSNLWPMGEYRSLLKFYLHPSASVEKIELNGAKLNPESFTISANETYHELSLPLQIAKGEKAELVLTYTLPNKFNSTFSYVFFDQKQAGITNKKTSYRIVFDDALKPQLIAPQANYHNKTISFINDNGDHFLFAVNFSRDLDSK